MEFEELKSIVEKFFQDQTIVRMNLMLNKEIIVSYNQFEEIIKDGDLTYRYAEKNRTVDFYEYRNNIHSIINYFWKDNKVCIIEIDFWRSR
ncbi:hypothetical protein SIRV1gp37 [Sulfolobus islandicus rod-shaped virus 1]|uniref:Uncharacterized protein 90B n=1 Tax=Sulfolobus islandicus rod-shaped virus 1 TaxID=157898 RepID=Y90B_SIRV1|nr:hypothetical protein SIRV1gp37 [Sulfolobus islandicus rod-shaped virus 1]Q8QL19.1 RecName: Full=Uncharacterized protein 90B [Sulfolobus islandicus rod-shaped virus 1]CAC93992.1 hypothetical protein [Sulfolobus islandicus rod-shaped virus 1]